MRNKSKKYIKILFWINILFGSYFLLTGTFLFLGFFFDVIPMDEVKINPFTYTLTLMTPALLLISSYILLKSKKKTKYKDRLGWLSIAFGAFNLINTILILFMPIEYTRGSLMLSMVFGVTTHLILVIDGFYLRKV